jgi:hypothetical protein
MFTPEYQEEWSVAYDIGYRKGLWDIGIKIEHIGETWKTEIVGGEEEKNYSVSSWMHKTAETARATGYFNGESDGRNGRPVDSEMMGEA